MKNTNFMFGVKTIFDDGLYPELAAELFKYLVESERYKQMMYLCGDINKAPILMIHNVLVELFEKYVPIYNLTNKDINVISQAIGRVINDIMRKQGFIVSTKNKRLEKHLQLRKYIQNCSMFTRGENIIVSPIGIPMKRLESFTVMFDEYIESEKYTFYNHEKLFSGIIEIFERELNATVESYKESSNVNKMFILLIDFFFRYHETLINNLIVVTQVTEEEERKKAMDCLRDIRTLLTLYKELNSKTISKMVDANIHIFPKHFRNKLNIDRMCFNSIIFKDSLSLDEHVKLFAEQYIISGMYLVEYFKKLGVKERVLKVDFEKCIRVFEKYKI